MANRVLKAKTQKARGVQMLHDLTRLGRPLPSVTYRAKALTLPENADRALTLGRKRWTGLAIMARPCPLRPRHGFVDSRVVATVDDLIAIASETVAAEPEAEIMLCPFIQAVSSAILTEESITIGPGHDGATSSRDCTTFPVYSPQPLLSEEERAKCGIATSPYIELLIHSIDEAPFVAQVRDGPKQPRCPDYIPAAIVVTEVVKAEGDLLAWERLVTQFPTGTVVVSLGGSLASHYGVHCLLNKIPFITTRTPSIGEVLEPTSNDGFVLNPDRFRDGVESMWGAAHLVTNPSTSFTKHSLANAVFYALHHFSAGDSDTGSMLAGFGVGGMATLLTTACVGEYRYLCKDTADTPGTTRSGIYKRAFGDPDWVFGYLEQAFNGFANSDAKSGVGGPRWAEATRYAAILTHHLLEFRNNPSEECFSRAVKRAHGALHLAHNGGWLLNKFSTSDDMTNIANGGVDACLRASMSLGTALASIKRGGLGTNILESLNPNIPSLHTLHHTRFISHITCNNGIWVVDQIGHTGEGVPLSLETSRAISSLAMQDPVPLGTTVSFSLMTPILHEIHDLVCNELAKEE